MSEEKNTQSVILYYVCSQGAEHEAELQKKRELTLSQIVNTLDPTTHFVMTMASPEENAQNMAGCIDMELRKREFSLSTEIYGSLDLHIDCTRSFQYYLNKTIGNYPTTVFPINKKQLVVICIAHPTIIKNLIRNTLENKTGSFGLVENSISTFEFVVCEKEIDNIICHSINSIAHLAVHAGKNPFFLNVGIPNLKLMFAEVIECFYNTMSPHQSF